eukprot:gene12297-13565_t
MYASVVTSCKALSLAQVQMPVAHSLTIISSKSKFCNICRQRGEDSEMLGCKYCVYYAHSSCTKDILHNCKRSATYHPNTTNKICSSSECLTGLRCAWCSITAHAGCQTNINQCCNYGIFSRLILPPSIVSQAMLPLWMSKFTGDASRKNSNSSDSSQASQASSSSAEDRHDVCHGNNSHETSNMLRIYDGDITNPHGWRNIRVSKDSTTPEVLKEALLQFRITEEQDKYYLARAISVNSERRLEDYEKPLNFVKNKKPQLFLRHNSLDIKHGKIIVYRGQIPSKQPSISIDINLRTPAWRIVERALCSFDIENAKTEHYCLVERHSQNSSLLQRYVEDEECLWEDHIGKRKLSLEQCQLTRYYLEPVPNKRRKTHLFVGNLPCNLTREQYELKISDIIGSSNDDYSIVQLFPLSGALVVLFQSIDSFISGYFKLKDSMVNGRLVNVKIIPNIQDQLVPSTSVPLLVFVNSKSGGGQGAKLINFFQRILNPHQVFDLMEEGPLPGFYTFRDIHQFRILICGGDGTFGWILSSIDEVNRISLLKCKEPASALLPLGTGNDLARVLNWGSGHTGSDDLMAIFPAIDEAAEAYLDRWNVMFDFAPSPNPLSPEEEQANVIIMNNYIGIGLDAVLALDFHLAREEQPDKFNSRLRNKGVYFKSGLKNMGKSSNLNLQDKIDLEVDGKRITMPNIGGLLIQSISSWAGGSDPWGKEKDEKFKIPSHSDGIIEVMGFTGVVHMGRIKSGLSSAIRICQGSQLNIKLKTEIPMQIDGEPWMQQPCDVIIRPTLAQAKMLFKNPPLRKRLSSKQLASAKPCSSSSTLALT